MKEYGLHIITVKSRRNLAPRHSRQSASEDDFQYESTQPFSQPFSGQISLFQASRVDKTDTSGQVSATILPVAV